MNWARFSGSGAAFLERGSSAPSSDALRGASSASTPPPLPANAAEISAAAKTSRTRATKDQQNLNPERRRSRLFDVFRKAPARGSTFEVLDRQKGRDIAQQRATSSSVPALVNAAPSTAERDPVGMWDDQAFTADKTSGTNDPSEIAHPGLAMSPVSHVSSADSYTAMAPPVVAVAPAVGPDPQVPTPSNSSTLSATASTGAGDAIDSSAAVPPRMSSKQILADSEKSSSQSAQPDAPGVEETPAVPEPAEAVAPMASTSAPAAVETGKRAAATGKEQKSEAKAAAKPSYPPSTTKTRPALSVSMGRRWSGVKGGSGSGTSGKSASSPIVSPEGSQTGFNLRSFRNVRSDSQGGESSEQSRRYSSVSVDECMTPIDPDAPPLPVSEQPDSPEAGSIAARSPSPTTTSGRPISPMSSPQLGMPGLQAQASSSSISVAKFRQAAGMRSRPDLSFNVDEFGATSSPGSGSNVAGGISERRASTLGAFSSGGMSQPAGPSSWGGNTPRAAGGRTPSMELAALEAELSMSNRASPMLRSTPRDGAMFDGRRPRAGSSNSQILAGKGELAVPEQYVCAIIR